MREIQPPNFDLGDLQVFLAGSIEMGVATEWQRTVIEACKDTDLVFLNPRRDEWDSDWVQSIDHDNFYEQVYWELNALERADMIVLYLDPGTKSSISLLELGLHAQSEKLIVCCPEGFWRKGNVDVVCHKYRIPQVPTLEDLIETIKTMKLRDGPPPR